MVNIYKQELTLLQQGILRALSVKAGLSLNQNGLARILNVSQPAIAKALPKLEKLEYIRTKKEEAGRWSIELNRESKKVIQKKRLINLEQVYKSGLVEFLEENFPGKTIVLFGSFSKGEDTINSDIDIAMLSKEKKIQLTKFEKIFEKTIFLHFYNSLKELNKELRENICNGIVLVGGIEL